MIMRISFGILLLVMGLCLSNSTFAQSCKFDRSKPQDGIGGHVLTEVAAGSVSKLAGRVLDPSGEPIPYSRVVVKRLMKNKAVYVGTQDANIKGRFCFGRLPSGTYRLENGHSGFNPRWTTVKVFPNRRSLRKRRISVTLDVGT